MIKKLAELWMFLIVISGVLFWFSLMIYMGYLVIFGESLEMRLVGGGVLAFMITGMAIEILDSPG